METIFYNLTSIVIYYEIILDSFVSCNHPVKNSSAVGTFIDMFPHWSSEFSIKYI